MMNLHGEGLPELLRACIVEEVKGGWTLLITRHETKNDVFLCSSRGSRKRSPPV